MDDRSLLTPAGSGATRDKEKADGRRSPRLSRATPTRQLTRFALGIAEGQQAEAVGGRDAALRRLLVMADILAAALALLVAVNLLGDDRLRPWSLLILPLVVVASRLIGLYDRDEIVLSKTTLNEGPALFHLATLYALLVYIGQGAVLEGSLAPSQGLALWGAFFGGTMACRTLIRRAAVVHSEPERCLLVGDPDRMARVTSKLREGWALNVEVVARVPAEDLPAGTEARGVLASYVREYDVHRIIVATETLDNERLLDIVRDMKALGVKVSAQPRLLDVVGSALEFEDVHGDVFIAIRRFGLTAAERRTKRTMDVIGSVLLLIGSAPFFAVVAIAIRLDSRGSVFFRQERVGRDGRRFMIWKFRTMVADAEQQRAELAPHNEARGGLFKMADDPRVTRVGRVLRRSSLDELPQLLNVLRGEMSLVGPRPLVVAEDAQIEGWHRRRLHLTPGMTGMWQVLGSARIPLHDMVALDYLYIVNWSVWKDLEILIRTAGFVLRRRGI